MASGRGRVTRVVSALRASPYNIPSVKIKIKRSKTTYSRVALLGLFGITREDDKSLLIRLQSLNINKFPLLAQIPPPVVNDNTYPPRLLPSDPSLLQFSERESTPLTDFPVVPDSLRADGRAEEGEGAYPEGGRFGFTSGSAPEFASWLVEPGADAALPVFAEVVRVEDVVVSETHRLSSE
jgi:hypothetical protein